MEVQIKYGINVVDPEDEICEFDLEESLQMQQKLENTCAKMSTQMFEIPECVGLFKRKYDVVEKSKLEKIHDQLAHLKERNKVLQK